MWPGMNPNNGPPPPHLGGWSGGAMDQNQWTTYYQTMPENQVDWAALAQQWIANRGTAQHQTDPNYSSGFSASARLGMTIYSTTLTENDDFQHHLD